MAQQSDLEQRLGDGLQRWARGGAPSLDLEAYVKSRTAAKPRRRWVRWVGSAAAAAALAFTANLTFPHWAGAAAGWPLVGPAVTEIIMKDAGLKWAYDMGLIQGSVAQVTEGSVKVKILGIVADPGRTMLMYQITGYQPARRDPNAKPIPASQSLLSEPYRDEVPSVFITAVNGEAAGSSNKPFHTPLGQFGTVSTLPLPTETAKLTVSVSINGKVTHLELEASRKATNEFSREVAVDQTKTIDGVTITVDSVVFTPAETVLRYRVEKPVYYGGASCMNYDCVPYLEVDGEKVRYHHRTGSGAYLLSFPATSGPVKFVVPNEYVGQPADLVWPLKEGAVQEIAGTAVTLTGFEQQGNRVAFRWRWKATDPRFIGMHEFEAVDAAGVSHPMKLWSGGDPAGPDPKGELFKHFESEVPDGFKPVAVRARQTGWWVEGPWIFELPTP